jgi:3-isopropylmalate/(R)-2-methylmalate dehydratase small subunit
MKAFRQHRGVVAPLLQANIDTDAIIPSREMKTVSRDGLGDGLFAAWRYGKPGSRRCNPDFVLNMPAHKGASILLAGPNLGCGSSREHAVWALQEFGFRVLIAPSFGAIFERNCFNNGILPLRQTEQQILDILSQTKDDPQQALIHIDLISQKLYLPDGNCHEFHTPSMQREMLLNGWDPIDLSLRHEDALRRFETKDRTQRPWVYCDHAAEMKKL